MHLKHLLISHKVPIAESLVRIDISKNKLQNNFTKHHPTKWDMFCWYLLEHGYFAEFGLLLGENSGGLTEVMIFFPIERLEHDSPYPRLLLIIFKHSTCYINPFLFQTCVQNLRRTGINYYHELYFNTMCKRHVF